MPGVPRPDAASLLDDIMRSALEVEYEQAAGRRSQPRELLPTGRQGWLRALPMLAVLGVLGVLVAASVTAERGNAARLRAQRPALVDRIERQTARVEELQRAVAELRAQVGAATRAELGLTATGRRLTADVATLEQATESVPARGDGVRVVVDDAPAASTTEDVRNRIYDTDLQQLVNGLWLAGADAIAVNRQRIGPMTAIRAAGDAILVGYRPLSRPYVVEAIGDPRTLEAGFVDGPAGLWLRGLRENYAIRFEVTASSDLALPGTGQLGLTLAGEQPEQQSHGTPTDEPTRSR